MHDAQGMIFTVKIKDGTKFWSLNIDYSLIQFSGEILYLAACVNQ